jgi:hypothetical protein
VLVIGVLMCLVLVSELVEPVVRGSSVYNANPHAVYLSQLYGNIVLLNFIVNLPLKLPWRAGLDFRHPPRQSIC